MPDIIVYGTNIRYIDVSNKEIKLDKQFNAQFGDPVPGQKKYLIIRRNNTLTVYDEVVSKEILKFFKQFIY